MICTVKACGRHADRVGARLCEMHYMRVRRHGDTDKKSSLIQGAIKHSHGYLLDHSPDHPLRRGSKRVYQHRVVFYDAHGEGPFRCHWCDRTITWDDMHVDHVDDDKTNNAIGNLVASCARCNQKRGQHKMRSTMRDKHAVTINGVTMCRAQWARQAGITPQSLRARIQSGMSWADAVSKPRGVFGPKRHRGGAR